MMIIVLGLLLLLGLQACAQGEVEEKNQLGPIVAELSDILNGIRRGESSAKQGWKLMLSHPDHSFIHERDKSHMLCFVLSQLEPKLLEDSQIKLLLNELPLFQEHARQVSCILWRATSHPQFYERYQTFIQQLPVLSDPKQWKHIIGAWTRLSNEAEKALLLESAKGFSSHTDPTSLLGQFCAIQEMRNEVDDSFIALLPVFRTPAGKDFLVQAHNSDPCREFLGRPESKMFKQLIQDARRAMREDIPKVCLPEDKLNVALANNLPVEEYLKLLKTALSASDTGELSRLIDYSDQLLQDWDVNAALIIASHLVSAKVPAELFTLYFERAGRLIRRDQHKFRHFLYEVLLEATTFEHAVFFKWYIELTSLEPSLLVWQTVSIPVWDALMRPMVGSKESLDLLAVPDSKDSVALLELIVAVTKCATQRPTIEPRKCEALRKLVRHLGLPARELLEQGHWRLASLTDYTSEDLHQYLRMGTHHESIAAVSWALGKLTTLDAKDAASLKLSPNLQVRALVFLFASLKKIPKVCRSPSGELHQVSRADFEVALEKRNANGEPIFSPTDQYLIVKSLIALVTSVELDDLKYVLWGEAPVQEMFRKILESYCGRWESLLPAIEIVDSPRHDE